MYDLPFHSVIRLSPVSKLAALGSNASFSCHSGLGETFWLIDGVILRTEQRESFEERGFIANPDSSNEGSQAVNKSMNVLASVENNNTIISCLALGTGPGQPHFSENATLTVAGRGCTSDHLAL